MNDPTDTETSRLTAHYAGLLARYGDDPRSLDWGSGASQVARFAVLAGIGNLRGTTILDVGCGLADFHAWLLDRGITHRYVGLDLTPEMAKRAAERFPEADILCGDIATDARLAPRSFDYVFASGIFALRTLEPNQYLNAVVQRLFNLCRTGVAFNSLSSWRANQEPGEFYADPFAVASRCAKLTRRLVLRHDYHPGDFTIYLYRGERS